MNDTTWQQWTNMIKKYNKILNFGCIKRVVVNFCYLEKHNESCLPNFKNM